MEKNQIAKVIKYIIIFALAILCLETKSFAASFSVSAAKNTLNVGDSITLTITANDCGGKFTITSSNSSVVSVSSSPKWIENTSSSITLNAKKTGTATITVEPTDVSDTSGNNAITESKKITITVKEQESSNNSTSNSVASNTGATSTATKSSDATLKSITVGSKKYTNPSTSITASNVSASTSSIKISAETNNSKAKVTGTGTRDLVTGTNKLTLKVTAEDGSTKTYTVKVVKLAEENETPNVIESSNVQSENKEEIALKLTTLEIEGITISPEFKEDVYEYTANIGDVESLNINAVANNEKAKIEISGNEKLDEGDNVIYIVVTLEEQTVTYKITANKTIGLTNIDNEDENINNTEESKPEEKLGFIGNVKNWWNNGGNIITVCVIILIMMGIGIFNAVIAYRLGKILREEYGYDFSKKSYDEDYMDDFEESISQEREELDDWYNRPENNIENADNIDNEVDTNKKQF